MLYSLYPFKRGDLIVFSGNKLDAVLVKWLTKSNYSHLAIVLDVYPEMNEDDKAIIIESTTYTSLPDFKNRKCQPGVQIHNLENWLSAYQSCGKAWCIPLKEPLSSEATGRMQKWLWNLYEHQVSYSCGKAIGSWLKINQYFVHSERQSINRMFCSELVTQALQIAGAIDKSILACQQTPHEVSVLPCFDSPVLLECS
ncbi:MAG: hypothetical protein SW833_13910 [Cyanobacteriota bacterium]|nr:hypothetical protein [Cyanobacteriota bacterium]